MYIVYIDGEVNEFSTLERAKSFVNCQPRGTYEIYLLVDGVQTLVERTTIG